MTVFLECAIVCSGSQKGTLLSLEEGEPQIQALAIKKPDKRVYFQSFSKTPISALEQHDIPMTVIQQVISSGKVFFDNAFESLISGSASVSASSDSLKRVLAHPIVSEKKLIAIIYLENEGYQEPFTEEIASIISILCAQAEISFQNVRYFHLLGEKIAKYMRRVHQFEKEIEYADDTRTRYLSTISNTIRCKLDSVIGFSKHLQHREPIEALNESTHACLAHIQQSTRDLSELLGNAFIFSDPNRTKHAVYFENLNLRLLILGIYQSNKEFAEQKSIHFHLRFPESLPRMVVTDRTLLNRALMNLISRTIQLSLPNDAVDFKITSTAKSIRFIITREQSQTKNKNIYTKQPRVVQQNSGQKDMASLSSSWERIPSERLFFDTMDLEPIRKDISLLQGELHAKARNHIADLTIQVPLSGIPIPKSQVVSRSGDPARDLRQMPQQLRDKIQLDFQDLVAVPIFMGGTLRRIIRKMEGTCEGYESPYPPVLKKIEAAIFEGDQKQFNRLIASVLADVYGSAE
ncbi:hypothetical protein KKI24_20635 [bacterium]|nr:hypothetical protein [bacterium]